MPGETTIAYEATFNLAPNHAVARRGSAIAMWFIVQRRQRSMATTQL
jgi:hypothetical protein